MTAGNIDILYLSDLHQGECGKPFDVDRIKASFDILVVAGDCASRLIHSLCWLNERFPGVPTVYVPGNHDYYRRGQPFDVVYEQENRDGLELAAHWGQHLLIDRAVEIDGIRFVGATLWTDLRPQGMHDRSQARRTAKAGMNDYRAIHRESSTKRSRRIKPEDTVAWHIGSRRFLREELAGRDNRNTIVVTHHAPSYRSCMTGDGALDHCYASDLTAEIVDWRPSAWIHGHVHQRQSYRIHETDMLCNPAGYEGEDTGFVFDSVLEIRRD